MFSITSIEERNRQRQHAVAVFQNCIAVRHVPWKISAACALFLQREGSTHCVKSMRQHVGSHEQLKPKDHSHQFTSKCMTTLHVCHPIWMTYINLAVGWWICQTAKFNSLLNFSVIRHVGCMTSSLLWWLPWLQVIIYYPSELFLCPNAAKM